MKPHAMQPAATGPDRLRIAYLMAQFPVPTQTFARSDIEALQADGHEVTVFALKPRGSDAVPGIASSHTSWRGALGWPRALWRMRGAVLRLALTLLRAIPASPKQALIALACLPRAAQIAEEIEGGDFDVVHLFWARHAALVQALLARRDFAGRPSTFVGAYDLVADDFLVELALASSDIVFSHCEANSQYLRDNVPAGKRIEIVPRGIPLLRRDRGAQRDPNLWLTASALVAEKNVEAVLTTFAEARGARPALRLQVFGGGPQLAALGRLAGELGMADAVLFGGHVSRETLFAAMERADTFLLLSKKPSERLPNVIKEALWAGCRVISSNSAGIEELLPDESIGLVVDPDDPSQVSRAIKTVLHRDPAQDDERQEAARTLIAERFSAAANMRRYVTAWASRTSGAASKVAPGRPACKAAR